MKRVLVDINSTVSWFALGRIDGIGRTTMELVQAMDSIHDTQSFAIELYSQNMKGIGAKDLKTRFKTHHLWMPKRPKFDIWVKRFHLRELLCRYDIMHIPHNFEDVAKPEKCITTIHDAMFFAYPEEAFNPEFCRREYTKFARQCRAVLTCSHSSKRDIVEYMKIPEEKVFVAQWGCNKELFKPTEEKVDKPFFLSASCDLGRKNTISLIRAFAVYAEKSNEHDLVLVWRNPPAKIIDEINSLGISKRVKFARNIPDEELANLYATATATFFPSLYEGFGLPVLESMACGTPVVTCDNSSLSEVGGEAAWYVEPYDIDTMADMMLMFDSLPEENMKDLRHRSLEQSHRFSWEECACKTMEVYKSVLS